MSTNQIQHKERPILFNSEMVRAILDDRKMMTRRVVSSFIPNSISFKRGVMLENGDWVSDKTTDPLIPCASITVGLSSPCIAQQYCPLGTVGDRLWVRETHLDAKLMNEGRVLFKADGDRSRFGWTPSIHMPRAASRITLEITAIRIERLQDITWDDAKAEGVETTTFPSFAGSPFACWKGYGKGKAYLDSAIEGFQSLWQSINGEESWTANPWVWVVEFKRVAI
jgi:hypothetical protein